MRKSSTIKKMTFAAVLIAVAMLLPLFTGQIPQIGNKLCPMHIPVLLCGFICGWQYGFVVGLATPLLRFLIFGMPPIFPIGLAMTFELAAYGLVAGLLYMKLSKTTLNIYVSLIGAMIAGRIVWGAAMFAISSMTMVQFSMGLFIAGAFVNAIPGIILQLVLIPLIVKPLEKMGYISS